MKAYPMSEVRKVFPEEPTQIEEWINGINFCIKTALIDKKRTISYLINRPLYYYEIDEIFKIYKEEGYGITLDTEFVTLSKIIISW